MLWFYKLSNFNILLLPTAGWYNGESGYCSSENSSHNPAGGVPDYYARVMLVYGEL